MLPIITVALTATILGGVLPFLVRPLLHTLNMVDLPNERSSHTTPTYRGMGLATALAVCASFGVATAAGWTVNTGISVTLLAGMAAALLLGWIEDVSGIGIAIRAGVQLLIGVGVAGVLSVLMNALFSWPRTLTWRILWTVLTVFPAATVWRLDCATPSRGT